MVVARSMRFGAPLVAGLAIGLIASCGARNAPARAETGGEVSAAPTDIDAVQQGCRTNQPWATDALCREAAEAIRRRFRGEGAAYTPHKVEPFPSQPAIRPAPDGKPAPQHSGPRPGEPARRKGEP